MTTETIQMFTDAVVLTCACGTVTNTDITNLLQQEFPDYYATFWRVSPTGRRRNSLEVLNYGSPSRWTYVRAITRAITCDAGASSPVILLNRPGCTCSALSQSPISKQLVPAQSWAALTYLQQVLTGQRQVLAFQMISGKAGVVTFSAITEPPAREASRLRTSLGVRDWLLRYQRATR